MPELTEEEYAEFKRIKARMDAAERAAERAPDNSPAERAAERRVETEEDRLRRLARESGVSYETLRKAKDEEDYARFRAHQDRYEKERADEAAAAKPDPEADPDPVADPEEEKAKGPKLPAKAKPTPTDAGPEDSHWSERPLRRRAS